LVEEEPSNPYVNNVDNNNNSNSEDSKLSEEDEEIGDSDLFALDTSIYELVRILISHFVYKFTYDDQHCKIVELIPDEPQRFFL
jgi:hypothetical protein